MIVLRFVAQSSSETSEPRRASALGSGQPLLEVNGLVKCYPGGTRALNGVSLELGSGELVAVLGSNGSGKSTLLRCVVGLTPATAGRVRLIGSDLSRLSGRELRTARRRAAVIFQRAHLVRRRSALDNVASGALGRHRGLRSGLGLLPAVEQRQARILLERVGLADLADQRAGTLSGGQAQRVAIARALSQQPAVVLADEPIAGLDPEAVDGVMRLLAELAHTDQLGVLCVLHQPDLAQRFADRTIALAHGEIVYSGPSDAIPRALLEELYRAADSNI